MKFSIEEIIENLLDEVLEEANTTSVNVGTRVVPNSVRNIGNADSDFYDEKTDSRNDDDENKNQTSKRSQNKNSVEKFMWGGDDPNNTPPKIKYIAT